jgi:manganese/zinc/iron transport system permease protein
MSYVTLLVLATTSVLGATAGVLGCYCVLRGRALVGDVLAHAALPGICLAFLVVGRRDLLAFVVGAFLAALAAVSTMVLVRRYLRTKDDAILGIVLSVFFGLGIVLLSLIQKLPTGGAKAGLEVYLFGQAAAISRSDLHVILAVGILVGIAVLLLYKEILLVTFDPAFARVQGWPVSTIDLVLMSLVATVTIIGLPAVGVVLMAALLIIPPAAARFWTDRLGRMLLLAAIFGAGAGILGTASSAGWIPTLRSGPAGEPGLPTGPMIILSGTLFFVISLAFAPEKGLVPRAVRLLGLRLRTAREHLLRMLYEATEPIFPRVRPVSFQEIRGQLGWGWLFAQLLVLEASWRGWVRKENGDLTLLPAGWKEAARVVRAHRLWELYLVEQAGIAPDHVHRDADEMEHLLPPQYVAQLEEKLIERLPPEADRVPASPHG